MAVVPTTTYLYIDTTLTQYFVQGTELVDAGPWSSIATYAINNVVQIGSDQYIALAVNTNTPPTGIVDENWSLLVVAEENAVIPSAGSDGVARTIAETALTLAGSAYDLAGTAYFWGTSAYDLAGTAVDMVVAETGSRIAADAAIVAFVFGSIAVDLAAETGSRIAADITEAGTRSQEDQNLQTQIIVEQGTRAQQDQFLYDLIIATGGTSFGSFVDLSGSLVAETGSRIAADQALATAIIDETGSRIAADAAIVAFVFGSIAVDLAAETGSRIAADLTEAGTRSQEDQVLATAIAVETGSRIAADAAIVAFVFGSIAVDLAAETGSRIAADLAEAGTRSQEDQFLQNQIIVEQGTRSQEDQFLQNQITTEQGTRAQEDQFLQTQITTESGTRSQQDQFLYNLIITTGGTSFGSFVDLSGSLAAETGSRIAADSFEAGTRSQEDQFLQTQITTEQGTRAQEDQFLQTQITTEQGTRSQEDQFLQTQITSEAATRAASISQVSGIASIGTNTGSAAYSVAQTAYSIAQIGTNTGTAAYQLAVEALGIAQAGTNANGKAIVLCAAYTPLVIGYDNAEVPVPYYAQDGSTAINWTTRRLNVRVQVSGSAAVVAFEKSTGTGAFNPVSIGTVSLSGGAYEGFTTNTGTGVTSGDKLRFNVLTLGSAQNWTCTVEISNP